MDVSDVTTEEYLVRLERDANTGIVVAESWHDAEGKLERGSAAAVMRYDARTGILVGAEYYKAGVRHREGGPAFETYDPMTNQVIDERWYIDDQLHRADGQVARTVRDSDGWVLRHEYWVEGKRHRSDGPALIEYDPETHEIATERHFRNGQEIGKPSDPKLSPS